MAKEPFSNIQRVEVLRYFRGTIILALVAVLLVVVGLLVTIRVERVSGTEVGVKLNNLTGDMSVLTRQGTHIYNGLLSTFHVLDRTVQRLEMTATPDRGDRRGADDVRVKTIDGSDVFLDLTINYRMLIDPESVKKVLLTSGSGNAYKAKWVRDYSRSICRTVFGELTTEQFYDSAELNMKKLQAKDEINENLKPFGLEVMEVVAEKFRFHEEYEAKIQEKKLADQEVEEQLSKANAARQNQIRLRVEAEKRLEVAVASYTGDMQKLVVDAEASAERIVKGAEAYATRETRDADAQFYSRDQNAQAITAKKAAEAEATAKMAQALEGDGGRNLVRLEYGKRLVDMVLTGQPYSVSGEAERFVHQEEGSVSARRPLAPQVAGSAQ